MADFLGYSENAVRWQIWTALLTYLLLRFVGCYNKWKHPFSRLFTLVRAVLWNFFRLDSIIKCCDTVRERRKRVIRGSPEKAYQLTFDLWSWFQHKQIYTQKGCIEKSGRLVLNCTLKSTVS